MGNFQFYQYIFFKIKNLWNAIIDVLFFTILTSNYQSLNDFYVNNLAPFYFNIIYRSQILHCFQYFVNQCNCSKGWQFLALLRDYHLANNLLSVIEIVTPSYDNFLNNRQNTYKVDAHCIANSSNVRDLFRIL